MILNSPERSRTYKYRDGAMWLFKDVTAVEVTSSGFHKLTYGETKHAIVAPGWDVIELDMDDWTF